MNKDNLFGDIFGCNKPIIGMVHLRPLPGSPLYDPNKMDMDGIIETAINERQSLKKAVLMDCRSKTYGIILI